MTPLQAIRQYCINCKGSGAILEVMKCDNISCPLYDFRCGTDPNEFDNLPAEERKQYAERLKNKKLYDDCIPE